MKTETVSSGLFVGTGGLSDVVLNWIGKPIEKFDSYAEAYHSAARCLLEKSADADLRDIAACPVVFLYRHALELYLKEILINGQKILELEGKPFRTPKEIIDREHNLSRLWNDLKTLYAQIDWQWEEELDDYGKIMVEWNIVDPRSFSFRCPVKKGCDAALDQDFRFDLRHFCQVMDKVLTTLGAISCGVGGVIDQMKSC